MIELGITLALWGVFSVVWIAILGLLPLWVKATLGYLFVGFCLGIIFHGWYVRRFGPYKAGRP